MNIYEQSKTLIIIEIVVASIMLFIFLLTFIPFGVDWTSLNTSFLQLPLGIISILLGFGTGIPLAKQCKSKFSFIYMIIFSLLFIIVFYLTFYLISTPPVRL